MCQSCGHTSPKWFGKCPDCDAWETAVEEIVQPDVTYLPSSPSVTTSLVADVSRLSDVEEPVEERVPVRIGEVDRVLEGGLAVGSVALIGGAPGIGKSTLALQVLGALSKNSERCLYVTTEESLPQVRSRASRLGLDLTRILVLAETDLNAIQGTVQKLKPDYLVLDSIQNVYHPQIASSPGSVSQVRECSGILTRLAKRHGFTVVIIGHITKEGFLAGPKVMEHLVDTVLYLEADESFNYRILRCTKNRYGGTTEIGLFQMTKTGLIGVDQVALSASALSRDQVGVAAAILMEGSRAFLVEVEALVVPSAAQWPRRIVMGVESQRLAILLAVIEKAVGLPLSRYDVYVNILGGFRTTDVSLDLAIVVAILSSFAGKAVRAKACFIGEAGLSGELRVVRQAERRVAEAVRLGFKEIFVGGAGAFDAEQAVSVDEVAKIPRLALGVAKLSRRKAVGEGIDVSEF